MPVCCWKREHTADSGHSTIKTNGTSRKLVRQLRKFETALQNSCQKTDGTGILIARLVMVNLYKNLNVEL